MVLIPSCNSFEYANNGGIKGCRVKNIDDHFSAIGKNPKGLSFYNYFHLNITPRYFKMPSNWTNGTTANETTNALRITNLVTQTWFLANPSASSTALRQQWIKSIKVAMLTNSGNFSLDPPFSIRSLAPYTEVYAWQDNDCK